MNKTGFGFLRLPMIHEGDMSGPDWTLINQMVDEYIEMGGTYFDTAYTYLDGQSEEAIKEAVVRRYPRERVWIADKLPSWKITSHAECFRYYEEQLERCGVTGFDTYLLHWLNGKHYEIAERFDEFGFLQELKRAGQVKKIGFSYHDNAMLLDRILTEHPEVDVVQLQINYLDWDSAGVQSRACYETAVKHHKSVVVMEPVKGGTLAGLPAEAEEVLKKIHPEASSASWAIRFALSLEKVDVVLSGMNSMEQIRDNMQDLKPLNEEELEAVCKVRKMLTEQIAIPCTGCRYCVEHCPKKINIPQYFSLYNEHMQNPSEDWKIIPAYHALTGKFGKSSDCIRCGNCERNCPQKLPIMEGLVKVGAVFE